MISPQKRLSNRRYDTTDNQSLVQEAPRRRMQYSWEVSDELQRQLGPVITVVCFGSNIKAEQRPWPFRHHNGHRLSGGNVGAAFLPRRGWCALHRKTSHQSFDIDCRAYYHFDGGFRGLPSLGGNA